MSFSHEIKNELPIWSMTSAVAKLQSWPELCGWTVIF